MAEKRSLIADSLGLGAAALLAARHRLEVRGWLDGSDAPPDALRETYNALLAFVAPQRDDFAGRGSETIDSLIATVDNAAPYSPNFAAFLAAVLNNIALGVNADANGPSTSPFARLSPREKSWVFRFMDTDEALREMSSVLPGCVAFVAHNQRQHRLVVR